MAAILTSRVVHAPGCRCGGTIHSSATWNRLEDGAVILGHMVWVCEACGVTYTPGTRVNCKDLAV